MILAEKISQALSNIDRVLIAVSGGVDSISLLHAVHMQCDTEIVALHVDHQLREASADEAKFVQAFCEERNIECVLESVVVNPDTSLQATARTQRHAVLRRCAARFGIKHILTAHHLDDFAETMLMNMGRGGGINALSFGLQKEYPPFIYLRPFFDVPRKEIENFANAQTLEWCEDPSNQKGTYLRNRLRHNLADLRDHYGDALKQSARRIQDAADIVNRATDLLWKENLRSSGPYHITFCPEGLKSDAPLLREFLRHVASSYFGLTLSETNVEQCMALILTGKNSSLSMHGMQVEQSTLLTFRKNFGRGNQWWTDINQQCVLRLSPQKKEYVWFDWELTILPKGVLAGLIAEDQNVEIRSWESGMLRDGKSLSKIVKTHTKNMRWRIPVLMVENNVVWILGDAKSDEKHGLRWRQNNEISFEI